MKPKLFALTAAIILLSSATCIAGNGYFNQVGRNYGYGVSDGYHAQRYCLTDGKSCNSCSPMQQPMMQQPMVPQPMMAPAYTQWVPQQFQQVGYPIGYPAAPVVHLWYQPVAPGYFPPLMPSVASPYRTPVRNF